MVNSRNGLVGMLRNLVGLRESKFVDTLSLKPEVDLFDLKYWQNMRTRVPPETLKKGKCNRWSLHAGILIDQDYRGNGFEIKVSEDASIVRDSGFSFHVWLENNQKGKRFIADGAAGYLSPEFPKGFYGFAEEAPENLRAMYENPSKNPDLALGITLKRVFGYAIDV